MDHGSWACGGEKRERESRRDEGKPYGVQGVRTEKREMQCWINQAQLFNSFSEFKQSQRIVLKPYRGLATVDNSLLRGLSITPVTTHRTRL